MRFRSAIVILLFLPGAMATGQEPISIALVRQDGYLIPIASMRGERVVATADATRAYNNLSWTFFPKSGASSIGIRTLNSVTIESYCEPQRVWRTTLEAEAATDPEVAIPTIGAAVRGASLDPVEDVITLPDEPSRRASHLAIELARAKERDALARETHHPYAKSTPQQRQSLSFEIDSLQRHTLGPVTTYYFEARKDVRAFGGEFVRSRGWIVDSGEGQRGHGVTFQFDDDSWKENDRATIWGVVPIGTRSLWIMEIHGYEWIHYALREWPTGIQRLHVLGPGC